MSIFVKSLSAVIKGIFSQRDVARIIQSGSFRLYFWRMLITKSFISGVISITVHSEINCLIFRTSFGFKYLDPNNSSWVIKDRKRFLSSRSGISVSSPFSKYNTMFVSRRILFPFITHFFLQVHWVFFQSNGSTILFQIRTLNLHSAFFKG